MDSRTAVNDVKFAPRHLGLQLVSDTPFMYIHVMYMYMYMYMNEFFGLFYSMMVVHVHVQSCIHVNCNYNVLHAAWYMYMVWYFLSSFQRSVRVYNIL